MRMLRAGRPFSDVPAEDIAPGETERHPVFSEGNLYPRMYKGDARFILAVAAEYERLIEVLGEDEVRRLLKDTS